MKRHKIEVTADQLKGLIAAGLIPADAAPKKAKAVKDKLRPESFTGPPTGQVGPVSFVVPVKTVSETNTRDRFKKNARTVTIRRAVSHTLGKHLRYLTPFAEAYHSGRVVRVLFKRLGGQGLDAMANLGPSMKAAEDALALMLGADDGSANWQSRCEQEPGGDYGILIVISLLD